LLRKYNIEIGGGLGEFKGKIWRVGTMGYSANEANILTLLSAFENILQDLGYAVENGAARNAAEQVYDASEPRNEQAAAQNNAQGETIGAESVARGVAHQD
jgi:alanine-glyoxylate transaminase/serine-glyoxylate transaminase/serine-pyruvate transaminase